MTALPQNDPIPMSEVYALAAKSVEEELHVELERVSGAIPAWLRGVLYRNGPGRQELFGLPYGHPFDGDGMVTRFEFSDTGVGYQNRYVRTKEYCREQDAARPLSRSFGTNLPGGLIRNGLRMRFKNAANTSVVHHGGKLLALWEGGVPHELDPKSLGTFGRFDYNGALSNKKTLIDRILAPELPFSAHPKVCVSTGELFNFGMLLGVQPKLMLYRVRSDGTMDTPHSMPLGDLSFVHDFVLTENYLVFFLPAVAFDVPRALTGLSTPADSLSVTERPGKVLVIRREDFSVAWEARVGRGFIFHFINGYERGDGAIAIDGCHLPRLPDGEATRAVVEGRNVDFPRALPMRFTLHPSALEADAHTIDSTPLELPVVDPRLIGRPYRYAYGGAIPQERREPFLTRIERLDVETGETLARDFDDRLVGEPIFVPEPDGPEGRGVLINMLHGAERAELLVVDAETLEDVAHYHLPHTVPPGFHGTFVSTPGG